jgi:uncharacterized protein
MSFSRSVLLALLFISFVSPALPQGETLLVPRGAEKPSFDCAKIKTAAARLICADAELSALDFELGIVFRTRKAEFFGADQSKFVAEQQVWAKSRNSRCGLNGKNNAAIELLAASKRCLANAIKERIEFLKKADSASTQGEGSPQRSLRV